MKLAEALVLRADLQKRVESLRARIVKNTVVQQGDKPAEDPKLLLKQASQAIEQLKKLMFEINAANYTGRTAQGRSLTEAIADRDALMLKHSFIKAAAESVVKPAAYGTREIRWVGTISAADLQKEADELAVRIRDVNLEIQEANWQIDI